MKKQSKSSPVLKTASAALFAMGGISSLALLSVKFRYLAVPAAALFTFAGGATLVANALLHPESIQIPDVQPPKIKVPTINVQY